MEDGASDFSQPSYHAFRPSFDDFDAPSEARGVDEAKGADEKDEQQAGGDEGDDDPEAREEPGAKEAFKDAAGMAIDLECNAALFYPQAMDAAMAILNKVR